MRRTFKHAYAVLSLCVTLEVDELNGFGRTLKLFVCLIGDLHLLVFFSDIPLLMENTSTSRVYSGI